MGISSWLYFRRNFYGELRKTILFLQEWRFGRSRSSKIIDFGTNRKRVCDFLLVRHSNLGPVLHRIRIYFIFPETRIIGLHFAANSMDLSSLKFFWWLRKFFFYFCKTDVSAVQGHPRSLILAPIESAYATSY